MTLKDLDGGIQSRKLWFAILLVIAAWNIGQFVSIEKLKLLLDFSEVVFGLYAGANVGVKFAGRSLLKSKKETEKESQED